MGRTISHVEIILFAKIACYEGQIFNEATIEDLLKEIPTIEKTNISVEEWLSKSILTDLVSKSNELGFKKFANLLKKRGVEEVGTKLRTNRPETIKNLQEVYTKRIFSRFTVICAGKNLGGFLDYISKMCLAIEPRIQAAEPEMSEEIYIYEELEEDELVETVWYLYHYQYTRRRQKELPLTEITRLVVHFYQDGGTDAIEIFERKPADDWDGGWFVWYENTATPLVLANLETDVTKAKPLHLRFFKHPVSETTILPGQFIDVEDNTSLISGNFVLQNAAGWKKADGDPNRGDREVTIEFDGDKQTYWVVTRELHHNDNWKEFIPEEIAKFLRSKWKNFTKINGSFFSLPALASWLKDKKIGSIQEAKYDEIIEFDMMIVTPTPTADKLGDYNEICDTFFKYSTKDKLPKGEEETGMFLAKESLSVKQIGFTRIYYAPRIQVFEHGFNSLGRLKPKRIIDSQLAAMRKSRCVLFILSEPACSSALVKIGWAMAMEKVCFIVETNENSLPKVLRKDYERILYHPENLLTISEIPEWLALEKAAELLD